MELILFFTAFVSGIGISFVLAPFLRVKRWVEVTMNDDQVTFKSNCNWDGDRYEIWKNGVKVSEGIVKGGTWT